MKIDRRTPHGGFYRGTDFVNLDELESVITPQDAKFIEFHISSPWSAHGYANIGRKLDKSIAERKKQSAEILVDVVKIAGSLSKLAWLKEKFPGFDPIKTTSESKTVKLKNSE